jgi:hypothetical protein
MRTCRLHITGASGACVTIRSRANARHDGLAQTPLPWGGWRHREAEEFFEWAARYDDDTSAGRNLTRHEAWLAGLPCRAIKIDGTRAIGELVAQILAAIDGPR